MFLQLTDSIYNRKNVVRAKAPHFPLQFEARKISRTVSHWGPLNILCPSLHSRPKAPSFSLELHSLWSRTRGLLFPAPALPTVPTSSIIKCQKQWRVGCGALGEHLFRVRGLSFDLKHVCGQVHMHTRSLMYTCSLMHTRSLMHTHTHPQKFSHTDMHRSFLFKHSSVTTQINV